MPLLFFSGCALNPSLNQTTAALTPRQLCDKIASEISKSPYDVSGGISSISVGGIQADGYVVVINCSAIK